MVVSYKIATPFLTPHACLAEGPTYVPATNELYFVDILRKSIISVPLEDEPPELRPAVASPGSSSPSPAAVGVFPPTAKPFKTVQFDEPIGVLGLTASSPKTFVVAAQHGFAIADLDSASLRYIANVYADDADKHARLRFNDGNVDPRGRFLAGSMIYDLATYGPEPIGSLFSLASDGTGTATTRVVLDKCRIPNGLQFSNDGKTMFHSDSPTKTVWAYDYDLETGVPSNKRALFTVDDGDCVPDGLTISAQGDLFVAIWDGSRVEQRSSVSGELKAIYSLPAKQVTCPTFGGPNLDQLFVTTASLHEAEDYVWTEEDGKADAGGEIFRFKIPGHSGQKRGVWPGSL